MMNFVRKNGCLGPRLQAGVCFVLGMALIPVQAVDTPNQAAARSVLMEKMNQVNFLQDEGSNIDAPASLATNTVVTTPRRTTPAPGMLELPAPVTVAAAVAPAEMARAEIQVGS